VDANDIIDYDIIGKVMDPLPVRPRLAGMVDPVACSRAS
jgi:hypothetical protein